MITPLIILILLLLPTLVWRGLRRQWHWQGANLGYALAFGFFAVGHFIQTAGMVAMLPEWLPNRVVWVYITGVVEAWVALMMFVPRMRTWAWRLAILLLVVFFPVNVYAAYHQVGLGGHQWGLVYLWIRAPLQCVLLGWGIGLLYAARKDQPLTTATTQSQ